MYTVCVSSVGPRLYLLADKLFAYLLLLAKNRNVTALFTFVPKSRPGPNTVYSLKYLPSKPENVTRAETEEGPPTSKKLLVFT